MDQVKIQPAAPEEQDRWLPTEGRFTLALAKYLFESDQLESIEAFRRVGKEAARIMGQCLKPGPPDRNRTGLIIGYVQSGKTMSMSAVSCLARDNAFRLVLAISGTTDNLYTQSAGRFERDLRNSVPSDAPPWIMWRNPTTANDARELARLLDEWRDASIPEQVQQPLFITVMKNHAHLRNLAQLLASSDLSGIDALIIDDEADQASLNTRPTGPTASTTYVRLRDIRSTLPKHTYLQYTATAQSLLLISLLDMLSPDFADTLEPGDDYTGGLAFFRGGLDLIEEIPNVELPSQVSGDENPPPSLLSALRCFFLSAVASPKRRNELIRSMLVHPDRLKGVQRPYFDWITAVKERWAEVLRRPASDEERQELAAQFEPEYASLVRTAGALPPLDELMRKVAIEVGRCQITKVNTDGREVNWDNGTLHILVGGQKLDRAYTVRGLVVTYMPRGPGTWTADTIQQRARFFGYKRSYLGFCRVYLEQNIVDLYNDYVDHEEHLRQRVKEFHGRPTRQLRRAFIMDPSFEPTRKNVLTEPYFRKRTGNVWFKQSSPHLVADVPANVAAVEQLTRTLTFVPHPDFPPNRVATGVPIGEVLDLLGEYAFSSEEILDAQVVVFHLLRIRKADPDATVTLFRMGPANRTVRDDTGQDIELHAGASATTGLGAHATIFDPDHVTLQLYSVNVLPRIGDEPIAKDVPALTVRIPVIYGALPWLVQPKQQPPES